MEVIQKILAHLFPQEHWTIQKPPAGFKESYIVESENRKLFLKFDVNTPTLHRLAEIGVTPSLLFVGKQEDRPFIIQEFVHGEYPDRTWLNANILILAQFLKTYHTDEQLRDILSENNLLSYPEHLEQELATLETDINETTFDLFQTLEFKKAFALLKERAVKLTPSPLVPNHSDPNYKNMLLTDKGLMMVDWDDIVLSDPMRDVGLILWWYIKPNKWSEFFELYGSKMDENKIYWWVAKRSLMVALWFEKRKVEKEAQIFLNDFYRAIEKKENPQVVA
jgi:thiamine kinase-like enzyme